MKKSTYHHGDLRMALLDRAELELQKDPHHALSIRSLAAQLGVSVTAPHAHFKTKADLLAALAARGFERLRNDLLQVLNNDDGREMRLTRLGERYLQFAADHAGLYRVMFTNEVGFETNTVLREASRACFNVLRNALSETMPDATEKKVNAQALSAWALVHGLASLVGDERISPDIAPDRSPTALAKMAAAQLVGR